MNYMPQYIESPEYGIRIRKGYEGIKYSDGAETEERLLRDVRACSDVSDGSVELSQRITDWASEYHFSPLRTNLLRPFSFGGKKVLELGCGCGAITRFFGESGAEVIALEGSIRRAAIAAARCRDLPNVKVVCDNLATFDTDEKFDVVTLIGVLEYSRLFIPGLDPVQQCLELARSYLNEDGVLYVAIENQLGLKYFNGCSEDHTGQAYFGINDQYGPQTVVTFGRKELAQRLQWAGFPEFEFFFPFPDYKLPELIIAENAVDHPSLRLGDLLFRSNSKDYGKTRLPSFNERLAWQAISRNGLTGDLANSFLVCARRSRGGKSADWLVRTYNIERLRQFTTENQIVEEQGNLLVVKQSLAGNASGSSRFRHVVGKEKYITGDLYVVILQRVLSNGGDIESIASWARPWIDFLLARCDKMGFLPGEYVDCIPTNLVRDQAGLLHYIDAEWQATAPIPFAWIAVRGLVIAISKCESSRTIGKMTYGAFVSAVLNKLDIRIPDEAWSGLAEWEDSLQECCHGSLRKSPSFAHVLSEMHVPWNPRAYSGARLEMLQNEIEEFENEIRRIKASFSWRMTKPVRFTYNLIRRLVRGV